MRAFNAFTSSGISAIICGAFVTALSPLLRFGERQGDGVLHPVRVPLPREPRKLYVLLGQVFDPAFRDEPGHLLPERRPPHHPVSPRGGGARPPATGPPPYAPPAQGHLDRPLLFRPRQGGFQTKQNPLSWRPP